MAEASGPYFGFVSAPMPPQQENFGVQDGVNIDYEVVSNAAREEVIETVAKKLYERECMTKLFFPLFWGMEEVRRVPICQTTSTFASFKTEDGTACCSHVHASKEELMRGEVCVEKSNVSNDTSFVEEQEPAPQLNCDEDEDVAMEQLASIKDLPNELLEYIFSFLDIKQRIRSELVCKRWRLIGKELPWTNATKLYFVHLPRTAISATPSDLSANVLDSVLSRCGACLKQILLSIHYNLHTFGLSLKLVETIVQYCPNLAALELNLRVTNSCLVSLARGCPKLKWLSIRCFNNDCNAGLLCLSKRCCNLERLSVSDLPRTGDFFDVINPNIQCIRLSYCTLKPTAMQCLMNRCNYVQELVLSSCKPVDQTLLFKVFERYQQSLKVLRFHCDSQVPDFNWSRGLKCLRNLEELCLGECVSVDDRLMEVLSKKCTKLIGLGISVTFVTDGGLACLKSLNLKVLDISMDHMVGNGLQALAKIGRLEKVYLDGTWNVSEYSCCTLATNCPNFRLLDVTGVKNITNNLVSVFCASKKGGYLKEPVQLFVGNTNVTPNVETCNGVEVIFDNQIRTWIASLI